MSSDPSEPLSTDAVPTLRVETRTEGDTVTLKVHGELDSWSSTELATTVESANGAGPRVLVVDLALLTFIDSAGVRSLVTMRDSVGAAFRLGTLSRQAERVLELTGLLGHFPRHPATDD